MTRDAIVVLAAIRIHAAHDEHPTIAHWCRGEIQ
jgi:hypothetical protein